jgi:hypothetical protein
VANYPLKLEPLCDITGYLTAPIPIGASSWGTRLIFPVVEGTFTGTKIKGKIRPFGADWGILRVDNCFELDVRGLLETDDGAVIHVYYSGIVDMTKEEADKFLSGEIPANLSIYVTPRFETSHQKYKWLNRVQAVGRGSVEREGDRFKVTYSWYILTA